MTRLFSCEKWWISFNFGKGRVTRRTMCLGSLCKSQMSNCISGSLSTVQKALQVCPAQKNQEHCYPCSICAAPFWFTSYKETSNYSRAKWRSMKLVCVIMCVVEDTGVWRETQATPAVYAGKEMAKGDNMAQVFKHLTWFNNINNSKFSLLTQ